ncbi:MAG: rhodanese-like domain-containing protein [Alphaproteobacteria bacterium]|nr:rhodanese-like domain-containing protein [Alphaproteobacteria bacterium]
MKKYLVAVFFLFLIFPSLSKADSAGKNLSVESVEGAITLKTDKAFELFEDGASFLDVRSPEMFEKNKIPESVNMFFKNNFTKEKLAEFFPDKDNSLVIYCGGIYCPYSAPASEKALKWGYKKVYYYREGVPAWEEAGNPVE